MPAVLLETLEQLFEQARTLPPSERASFLESCSDDPAMRDELASLLAAADGAEPFFADLADLASPNAWVVDGAGAKQVAERAAESPASELEAGQMVAQYRIEERLGAGGMGVVYRATDTRLGRNVALKFLPHHLSADETAKERFLVEARAAAALDHPNVCALHEIGEADGRMYIAMGYYGGQTLSRALEHGPLPAEEALDYARQVASALQAAHARGIVHRDVKPGNILIADDGTAKVLDFGLAKLANVTLTDHGARLGTVAYMSPEQTRGDAVDERTDFWSLGAVLHEMLTGRRPFRGENDRVVIQAIRHERPEPPSKLRKRISADLDAVVLRLLAKEPDARETAVQWLLGRTTPSSVSRWLHEAHRRSVWQVLVGWAVGGWLLYALAGPLADAIGLPLWFGRGVLLVLLAVLPVLLVTGVARGKRRAALRNLYQPGLTWRNAGFAVGAAFALLGLATAGYLAMRTLGIGPAGTVISRNQLEPEAEILLADFASAPEDSALARTVTEAFRMDIAESPSLTLAGPGRIGPVLARMERPGRGALDVEAAREVALRGGIPAIIDGEIRRLGEGFVLTAELISPSQKRRGGLAEQPERVLAVSRATAASEDELIAAIDRLSKGLRERIGEPLRSLRRTQSLMELTTSSVTALERYFEAVATEGAPTIQLLEEAVALDADFAEAWRKLGVELRNAGRESSRQVEAYTRAFELRDRLSDRERYLIEATYYRFVTAEYAKTIQAAQSYLARNPAHPTSNRSVEWFGRAIRSYLVAAHRQLRRYDLAEEMAVSMERDFPIGSCSGGLLSILLDLGELDEARRYADDLSHRCADISWEKPLVDRVVAVVASELGDLEVAEQRFRASRDGWSDNRSWPIVIAHDLASLYATQGRLAESLEQERVAMAEYDRRELPADYLQAAVRGAAREALLTGTARRLPEVEAELERSPLADLHPLDRPYLPLVTFYSQAARPRDARRLLAEFENAVERRLRGPFRAEYGRARGELALAEGRYKGAVTAFRASNVGSCQVCALSGLARAYDASGQADSAIAVFRRYVDTPSGNGTSLMPPVPGEDRTALGPSLERLAQLYDERDEKEEAAAYYARFTDLWRNADLELQQRVEAARARLAELPPPPEPAPTAGSVRVTTSTAGEDLDLSGYLVTVEKEEPSVGLGKEARSIGLDDAVSFRFLSTGGYTVRLDDIADNCVIEGATTRQISVTAGATAEIAFDLSCARLPRAAVDVTGTWRGKFDGLYHPWRTQWAGTYTYVLKQDGDDVTGEITLDDPTWPLGPSTYEVTGRVSGRTLTLFSLRGGSMIRAGPSRVTATLQVSGDEMTGRDVEQQGVWEATMTLSR